MTTQTIDIPPLGPVLFAKTKRTKRLSITVKPFRGIRVAVPYRLSFKDAQKYLLSNITWAKKSLDHIKEIEQEHITTVNSAPRFNKTKARAKITQRLDHLADKHGFTYNRLFIRNQKTRWGSCSEINNINLNINLARLTDELMDYVMLHELVHINVKNHSKQFWSELDKYVGNAKQLDKKLKKHRLGIVTI